jgi:mutator protein MutT
MRFDEEFDVVAAVIRKGEKILITKRLKDSFMGGRWEFPGGKVECDEDYEQALVREITEELGVKITIIELFHLNHHVYDSDGGKKRKVLLISYEAEIPVGEGEIQCIGVQEYKWVLPAELKDYDFVDGDIPVIKRLLGN